LEKLVAKTTPSNRLLDISMTAGDTYVHIVDNCAQLWHNQRHYSDACWRGQKTAEDTIRVMTVVVWRTRPIIVVFYGHCLSRIVYRNYDNNLYNVHIISSCSVASVLGRLPKSRDIFIKDEMGTWFTTHTLTQILLGNFCNIVGNTLQKYFRAAGFFRGYWSG